MQTRSDRQDLYAILGVEKTASHDEIRKAYRAKALIWHPDKVDASKREEAEEVFKDIKEAYDVLSDDQKRQLYDQYGAASLDPLFEPPGAGPPPSFQQDPSFQYSNASFRPGQQGFPFQQGPFQQSRPVPQPSNYGPRPPYQMYRSASSMNLRPGPSSPLFQDMYGGQYGPYFQPQFFPPTQIPTPAPSSPAPTFPTGAPYFPANPIPVPPRPPPQPVQQPVQQPVPQPMYYYYLSPSNAPPFQIPTPVQSPPPMEYYNLPQSDYFSQRPPPGWAPPPPNTGNRRPSRLRRRSSAGEIRSYPAPTMWTTVPQPTFNQNQVPVFNMAPPPPAPPAGPNGNRNESGRKASTSGKQQKSWFPRFFNL